MKKLLVLLLVLSVVLCACNKGKNDVTTVGTTTSVKEPLPITALPEIENTTEESGPVIAPEATVVVTNETLSQGDGVDVSYEVVRLGDEEVDEILKSAAETALKDCIPNISSIERDGGTAEYDVKLSSMYQGEDIISAVFSGEYAVYYETSEKGGEVLYTVNIDPVTGKLLETTDIVDYEKMVEAFESGRFDKVPDLSQYAHRYPYVAVEAVDGNTRLCVYVTESGMYDKVFGYYFSIDSASDFLKINLSEKE